MTSTYSQLIQRLYSLNQASGMKLGLSNMQMLSRLMGFPEETYPCVHVAGTNGKGSVSTKMAKILELADYNVGLYTSPHISSFRERIRVNGVMISEEETVQILTHLFKLIDEHKIPATFFELTTTLALTHFARHDIDIAVIETGLGGRLDATNIIHPIISIITSISLDHTEILGDSIEQIAQEKGGIIKSGVPVIIGPRVPKQVIKEIAAKLDSPLTQVKGSYSVYEEENNAIVQCAMKQISDQFSEGSEAVKEGIQVRPPCRFEKFGEKNAVILDVAHNPDGFEHLLAALQQAYPQQQFRFVVGLSSSKDVRTCLQILKPHAKHFDFVCSTNARGMPSSELLNLGLELGIDANSMTAHPDLKLGIKSGLDTGAKNHEVVVICGTFFIMREAREVLGLDEPRDPLDLN